MKSLSPRALVNAAFVQVYAPARSRDPVDLTGEDPFPYDTLQLLH